MQKQMLLGKTAIIAGARYGIGYALNIIPSDKQTVFFIKAIN